MRESTMYVILLNSSVALVLFISLLISCVYLLSLLSCFKTLTAVSDYIKSRIRFYTGKIREIQVESLVG